MGSKFVVGISVLLLVMGSLSAGEAVRIEPDGSVFAVITRKGGFAAGLAHNHLVAASNHTVDLRFDEASPLETSMEFSVASEDLVVNDPDLRRLWYPRLEELGILDEPFGELSEKNRAKIRKAMLGKKQLAAETHPTIRARIVGVRDSATAAEGSDFPYEIDLAFTVRDVTVTETLPARYENLDGTTKIEAFGTFRFTDFGIKPYSAMLGAVKNLDEFYVFTSLSLRRDR